MEKYSIGSLTLERLHSYRVRRGHIHVASRHAAQHAMSRNYVITSRDTSPRPVTMSSQRVSSTRVMWRRRVTLSRHADDVTSMSLFAVDIFLFVASYITSPIAHCMLEGLIRRENPSQGIQTKMNIVKIPGLQSLLSAIFWGSFGTYPIEIRR